MGIREEQKQQTYQKILEAIQELVNEKDYEAITIREIAQHAGISVGTYYKHFKSKDDIIFNQIHKSYLKTQETIAPQLNKKTGIENLEIYLEKQYDILGEIEIPWLREVFRVYLYHKVDEILDQNNVNYQVILDIIEQGQKDGSIRQDVIKEELAWSALKCITANFYSYCMQDGNFDLKKVMKKEAIDLVRAK